MEVSVGEGRADFDKTENFSLTLPTRKDFNNLNLAADLREDIHKAEKENLGSKQ